MKKWIWTIFTTLVCYTPTLAAFPTVVPDPIPCVRDLELHFFNERIVNEGLSFYYVRQEIWSMINQTLRTKSLEIPDRMKVKTAYMVPNPIEFPMQKGPTARILKQVLFEVFFETMTMYYANERPTVDLIFDYIFTQQLPNFVRCFGDEARELAPKFD